MRSAVGAGMVMRAALSALVTAALVSSCSTSPPDAATTPSPTPVPDSGFDVATNGFSFANYGNEDGYTNLDADTMRTLFGDRACARIDGDGCTLYPSAKAWMRSANDSMNGGHCFGMAGLSWALYARSLDPQTFGGPDAADLRLAGNPDLQRELAQLFATQYTKPTSGSKIDVTPTRAMSELEEAWGRDSGYVLAIYRMEDGEQVDGHAITPIAVRDTTGDQAEIVVYDNNFPGEPKRIVVDKARDRWEYTTTSDPRDDPEPYEGGPRNKIELFPVATMLEPQQCPFCSDREDDDPEGDPLGSGAQAPPPPRFNTVFLNQEAGHRGVSLDIASDDGGPVPGHQSYTPISADDGPTDPAIQFVPKDEPFVIDVDAADLRRAADTDVTIVGPGYDFAVADIDMRPGQRDVIRFDPQASRLRYQTDAKAAPDIVLGLDDPEASYAFGIGGLRLRRGGEVDVQLDPVGRTVTASAGNSGRATIDFQLDRITDTGDETYTSEPIPLERGESIVLQYGRWKGDGSPMPAGIDYDGDGVIDEKLIPPDAG